MNQNDLNKTLRKHALWLAGELGGELASLRDANLRDADLQYADLRNANLRAADLEYADLRDADLRGADLEYANLQYANLRGADLRGADLRGADLRDADLRDADLRGVLGVQYAALSWDGHGECGRQMLGVLVDGEPTFFCGCFRGTFRELGEYIRTGCSEYRPSRTSVAFAVYSRLMQSKEARR